MKASRGPRIEPALACDPGRSLHLWLLKIQNRSIWRENSLFLEKSSLAHLREALAG